MQFIFIFKIREVLGVISSKMIIVRLYNIYVNPFE